MTPWDAWLRQFDEESFGRGLDGPFSEELWRGNDRLWRGGGRLLRKNPPAPFAGGVGGLLRKNPFAPFAVLSYVQKRKTARKWSR